MKILPNKKSMGFCVGDHFISLIMPQKYSSKEKCLILSTFNKIWSNCSNWLNWLHFKRLSIRFWVKSIDRTLILQTIMKIGHSEGYNWKKKKSGWNKEILFSWNLHLHVNFLSNWVPECTLSVFYSQHYFLATYLLNW